MTFPHNPSSSREPSSVEHSALGAAHTGPERQQYSARKQAASRRRTSLLAVAALSAGLLVGCNSPEIEAGDQEGTGEEEGTPSNAPSAENPESAEDVDVNQDVAMMAVNTALNDQEGIAVGFQKDLGEDGMGVDLLVDDQLITTVTSQEGTAIVDTRDGGEAEDNIQELADESVVPLLRAMSISQTESAGMIIEAHLEEMDDDLLIWRIIVEGPTTDSSVLIDARNGAIVSDGDDPVDDINIGGDPENDPLEDEGEPEPTE